MTSRIWRDRDDWRDARRKDGPWADVRAYDADDLVTWLERAPSVHYWISEQLDREPRDVRTPDSVVGAVGQPDSCRPSSRASCSPVATAWSPRSGTPSPTPRSRSPSSRPPGRRRSPSSAPASSATATRFDALRARAVIVSAPGAWDRLVDSDNALVLIPNFDDADIASARSKGHHVVIPLGRDARHAEGHIVVPLLDRATAAEAILDEAAGITRDVANRHAAHAHRNLLSLRRTLAVNPRFARPPWSEGEQGRRLAPLVLAGSWSDDVDGDRTAIEALTGRPYAEVEGDLASWAAQDDAPVTRTGQVWRVVSKEDAWDLVSALITKTTLSQFHEVAARGPRGARSRARCPR